MGEITFDVPQVHDSNFYLRALGKGLRSVRVFTMTFAELYNQGVSTQKVKGVTEKLCDLKSQLHELVGRQEAE